MSLMAGLTVLVKIIRSDVRVSFVSGPVTSQSVGSIVIEADPSLSFVVPPVSHPSIQSHPTISHYKEPQKETRRECCQWKKTEWKSLWRIRPQLFFYFLYIFQEYRIKSATEEWHRDFLPLVMDFLTQLQQNESTAKDPPEDCDWESILLNLFLDMVSSTCGMGHIFRICIC